MEKKLLEKSVKIMIGKISGKIGGKLVENLLGKLAENRRMYQWNIFLTSGIYQWKYQYKNK